MPKTITALPPWTTPKNLMKPKSLSYWKHEFIMINTGKYINKLSQAPTVLVPLAETTENGKFLK